MSRRKENNGFMCTHCGAEVSALTNGSYRNHCPYCLYSLHIDNVIGDRLSDCSGEMRPIKIIYHSKKGYQIVHKCLKCGVEKVSKIANDTDMPDDLSLIIDLMINT